MSFLNTLFGRGKPEQAMLNPLLTLPGATHTLGTALGFMPTGMASICFRAAEGRIFRETEYDVRDWLNRDVDDAMRTEISEDSYGFTWLTIRRPPDRFRSLVEDLHAASFKFSDDGFGPQLLCAVTGLRDSAERNVAIVYLYKQGTFYPFAPLPGRTRDNRLELDVSKALKGTIPLEDDVRRWFAVWDAPGL